MHFSTSFTTFVASASLVLAHPVDLFRKYVADPTISHPCALVSSSSATQATATGIPQVDGKLAYACLNSVALDKNAALDLVEAILPYVEWQSSMLRYDLRPHANQTKTFHI
jgi:hypothetical protein